MELILFIVVVVAVLIHYGNKKAAQLAEISRQNAEASRSHKRNCPFCHKELASDSKFCFYCGKPLSPTSAKATTPQTTDDIGSFDRYTSFSGEYKYCSHCMCRNPASLWRCLECSYRFPDDELPITHPFFAHTFASWLSPQFYTHRQRLRFNRALKHPYKIIDCDEGTHTYTVLSTDGEREYEVSPNLCTCRDFEKRNLPCKHMYSVMLQTEVMSREFYMYRMPHALYDSLSDLYRSDREAAESFADVLDNTPLRTPEIFIEHNTAFFSHVHTAAQLDLLSLPPVSDDVILSYVYNRYTVDAFKETCRAVVDGIKFPSTKKQEMMRTTLTAHGELKEYFSGLFAYIVLPEYVFYNAAEVVDCIREQRELY